jgi:Fe-S oxidoreductase
LNPVAMLSIIVAALAAFAWSASRRWQLLKVGAPENRLDNIGERIGRVLRFGVKQEKMHKYKGAGAAHLMVFLGFGVLLLNTLILWARGFSPDFAYFLFNPGQPLGDVYGLIKEVFAVLVMFGASYFLYLRIAVKPARMTLSGEGILILCIILTMMVSDILYNGAAVVLHQKYASYDLSPDLRGTVDALVAHRKYQPRTGHVGFHPLEPAGSITAIALQGASPGLLAVLAHIGFWTHSSLVLIFLNLLPHSKHFHIITGLPNIFASDLHANGRLHPIGGSEALMEKVGAASELPEPVAYPGVGIARMEHFTWKAILDFYTCTECGRCSDNCPAHLTGKLLSPKHLTLDLRNHLYAKEKEYLAREGGPRGDVDAAPKKEGESTEEKPAEAAATDGSGEAKGDGASATNGEAKPFKSADLVVPSDPALGVIHPDVIWGCTTCRACEEQCPVLISYVDKIVDMRRNVVMVRGEFPHELQRTFTAIETNGNPWNLSRMDRAAWSDGLEVATIADKPDAKVLYWVGCAASYDDRAKKIARATARLMKQAGVDFAVLGQEESCTGDPARRAGNEFLFVTMAEANVATLNGYEVGKKRIVTACPHCFNALLNEYPDFGGKYEVVHHTTFLLELLDQGKLKPNKKIAKSLVYHDSCYLGRYNDVYDAPREILSRIGATLHEAQWSRSKGLCCGGSAAGRGARRCGWRRRGRSA